MIILGFIILQICLFILKIIILTFVVVTLLEKRSSKSTIAWLLAFAIVPYLFVPLYFIFGFKKRDIFKVKNNFNFGNNSCNSLLEAHINNNILINHKIALPTTNNSFELYTNGVKAYKSLLYSITKAQRVIYISTYVFQNDSVTYKILEVLTKKASEGVEVKVLIDCIGSYRVYLQQKIFKNLRKFGGIVYFFTPIIQKSFKQYINFRNHRKIYLIDNTVFTGGMNLGTEYMGPDFHDKRWYDLLFKVQGQSISYFYNVFCSDWQYATKELIPTINYSFDNKQYGFNALQVVPSGPDILRDTLYDALLNGIYKSSKRIWIVTPYFVPSESLFEALKIACNRGVDVKLITPKVSNHMIIDLARGDYIRRLQTIGVKIALFSKKMIHAKAVLFDGKVVMLGSVNLDHRSLFLNYEIVTFVYSKRVINIIYNWMNNLFYQSTCKLSSPSSYRRLFENLIKLLTPLL